jgi:hypothetical protein
MREFDGNECWGFQIILWEQVIDVMCAGLCEEGDWVHDGHSSQVIICKKGHLLESLGSYDGHFSRVIYKSGPKWLHCSSEVIRSTVFLRISKRHNIAVRYKTRVSVIAS